MGTRHQQAVAGEDGPGVEERHRRVLVEHDVRRGLTRDDPAEHAVGHPCRSHILRVGHQCRLKHHCWLAAARRPWATGQNTIDAQCRPGLRSANTLPGSGRSSIWYSEGSR